MTGAIDQMDLHTKTCIRPCHLHFFRRHVFVDCNDVLWVSLLVKNTISIRLVYSVLCTFVIAWVFWTEEFWATVFKIRSWKMSYCRSLTLELALAKLDKEFKSFKEEYMAPRAGEDVCTNEEDADKSATAFSPPELTSQPKKTTNSQVAKLPNPLRFQNHTLCRVWTITVSRNSHGVLCKSNKASGYDGRVHHRWRWWWRFLTRTCGCMLGSGKLPCSSHISQKTITHQLSQCELDITIMVQLNALRHIWIMCHLTL